MIHGSPRGRDQRSSPTMKRNGTMIPLPNDTGKLVEKTNGGDNGYLLLRKYLQGWNFDATKMFDDESKKAAYAKLLDASKNGNEELYTFLGRRQQVSIEAYRRLGFHCESFELVSASRMIIGIGESTVFEVGLTLHSVFGIPYIPASAIKGVTRSWAEQFEETEASSIKLIFGSETKDEKSAVNNQKGGVFFLDAWPVEVPELEKDIMTPHYGKYYMDGEPPGDWLSPVPIPFVVVKSGIRFRFSVVGSKKVLPERFQEMVSWLKNALTEIGIGAKTSLGYGLFVSDSNATDSLSESSYTALIEEKEMIEERSDWALELEARNEAEDTGKSLLEVLEEKIRFITPQELHGVYEEVKDLPKPDKAYLAKVIQEKHAKYLKDKSKKEYIKEILSWTSNE